jgi:hypothetical protein
MEGFINPKKIPKATQWDPSTEEKLKSKTEGLVQNQESENIGTHSQNSCTKNFKH